VFPTVPTAVVQYLVDPATFYSGDPKTRSIAYMPRKRREEATEVLAILGARGALDGWDVVPIANRSEAETAEILRGASVFLSFSHREGFGLPPAEALACGCVVAGFHGFGGRDISPHALWVPEGDVREFARTVERILESWDRDSQSWARLGDEAARHIRSTYTPHTFRETVDAAFDGLGSPGDLRIVGRLPTQCWSAGPVWPRVRHRLRSVARVAISGST
jgi:glycosyltransferase involved in cell wall biosynthesis